MRGKRRATGKQGTQIQCPGSYVNKMTTSPPENISSFSSQCSFPEWPHRTTTFKNKLQEEKDQTFSLLSPFASPVFYQCQFCAVQQTYLHHFQTSVHQINSDLGPGKWQKPWGQGSRSSPMDLEHYINWVHCSYCSSLKIVIFQHVPSSFSANQVVSSYPSHLVLNRSFSSVFFCNHRNTRLKLPSLN